MLTISQKSPFSPNAAPDQVTIGITEGFKRLKAEARSVDGLTKLKSWFKYISEWPIEEGDVNYQVYIKSRTVTNPICSGR